MNSSKRLRLHGPAAEAEQAAPCAEWRLPPEALALVMRLCSWADMAERLRLVNHSFATASALALNTALLAMDGRLRRCAAHLMDKVDATKLRFLIKQYLRSHAALLYVQSQYWLVHAATWRYHYRMAYTDAAPACFYGGRILDLLQEIIDVAYAWPRSFGRRFLRRDGPWPNWSDLSKMVKRFLNSFERVTEPQLCRRYCGAGAKTVDLLDCLLGAHRSATVARDSTGLFHIQVQWRLPRAWFLCVPYEARSADGGWKEAQRFMHMRVRRIVSNHNRHFIYAQCQYREQMYGTARRTSLLPSTYSGYGYCQGQLFYYGILNASEYLQIFHNDHDPNDDSSDEEEVDGHQEIDLNDSRLAGPPTMDLLIYADLKCSLQAAPFSVVRNVNTGLGEHEMRSLQVKDNFQLTLTFYSEAARDSHFPSTFTWRVPPQGLRCSQRH